MGLGKPNSGLGPGETNSGSDVDSDETFQISRNVGLDIDEIVCLLDSQLWIHLTKENFDKFSRVNSCKIVIKPIMRFSWPPLQVKTAFTRRYNKEGGFLPYSIVQHAKKKAGSASAEASEFGEEVIFSFLCEVE